MSEIEDRRQRAREVYWDVLGTRSAEVAAQEAIETATRVKITDEMIQVFRRNMKPTASADYITEKLATFFTAAGFEVEQ